MKKVKISVYRYHDYRSFIIDWMKVQNISLRQLAQKLDISASYLSQVLGGKKEFSVELFVKFKKYFKLDKDEMKHLLDLLNLSRSNGHQQRVQVYNKILKDKAYTKINTSEQEAFSYLSQWYFVALKEYFSKTTQLQSFSEIKENFLFKIKTSEIKRALLFLTKEKFIEINPVDSSIKILKEQVDCYSNIYRLSLGQFHAQMFGLAVESIEKVNRDERLLLGNSICVSEDSFNKIKQKLQDIHNEIRELEAKETNKERVYHVGLVAFPLTKKNKYGKQKI